MLTRSTRPQAVVIGAGLGGLAAAIRLGARGYAVTVLDKLSHPGGRATVYKQDGFTFDAGPTIITAPFVFDELWAFAGRKFSDDVKLKLLDPYYIIRFDDGDTFTCRSSIEAMRDDVRRISPADVAGYDRFMAESEAIYRVGFEKLAHVPFSKLSNMIAIVPELIRLKAWRSVHSHVAAHIKHPKLRMALSFHPLFVGGNPFKTTAVYSMIAFLEREFGVHCAIGGTGAIVDAMVRLIESQGGVVRCDSEIVEITTQGRRATGVRTRSGESITADIVISNACTSHTFTKLLHQPRPAIKQRHSMSLFVWYFGTNKTFPTVPHHTILMGPRYRELISDIFDRKILADDMSLYLHRPTASDTSLAPEGCDSFYVLSPVPNQDSGVNWSQMTQQYRQRIAARLDQTIMPGFAKHIVTEHLVTPDHFEHVLLSHKGAAFGLEPILTQSAWFRPHNKNETFDNLYLVGAGTHPGAGIPGVVSSARVLDTVVPPAGMITHAAT